MKEGNFESLSLHAHDKIMLKDAYDVITQLELWDWLKSVDVENTGFMFSRLAEVENISNHLTYQGHSGASFGMTMRTMQQIARDGWDSYEKKVYYATCPCYRAKRKIGWCGVAGGGVPGCEH